MHSFLYYLKKLDKTKNDNVFLQDSHSIKSYCDLFFLKYWRESRQQPWNVVKHYSSFVVLSTMTAFLSNEDKITKHFVFKQMFLISELKPKKHNIDFSRASKISAVGKKSRAVF